MLRIVVRFLLEQSLNINNSAVKFVAVNVRKSGVQHEIKVLLKSYAVEVKGEFRTVRRGPECRPTF